MGHCGLAVGDGAVVGRVAGGPEPLSRGLHLIQQHQKCYQPPELPPSTPCMGKEVEKKKKNNLCFAEILCRTECSLSNMFSLLLSI